jgi:Type II secretory pathway, component PulD
MNMSVYNKYGYKLDASIYALDQSDATDILSCPRVTTMNGQPATIKMVTEKYYPTNWEDSSYTLINNVPVFISSTPELDEATQEGIIFTVTPNVSSDKYTINLLMQPLIQKFTGWDDYSYQVPIQLDTNNAPENVTNTLRMPKFERRTTKTNVECTDNGTIVMGGMIRDESTVLDDKYPILGDLPLVGRLFQSKGRAGAKSNLLIFLSCRLVNPDGSPLREREDRGIPPFRN